MGQVAEAGTQSQANTTNSQTEVLASSLPFFTNLASRKPKPEAPASSLPFFSDTESAEALASSPHLFFLFI
jgi:hypothetical protein